MATTRGSMTLAGGFGQHSNAGIAGHAQYFDFTRMEPDVVSNTGSRTWLVRAKNIVLVLTELKAGDHLTRTGDVDEYMLVLTGTHTLGVRAGDRTVAVTGRSIVMIPPGDSEITANCDGRIIRLFPLSAADLTGCCRNSDYYVGGAPHVAKSEPWPAPEDAAKLRVYTGLDDIPASPSRMGRIYRNRHAMVNFLYPRLGPRDPSALSPHHHDDFEQLSYADSGEYVHHIRAPWTKDRRDWRPDEHVHIGSPSLVIIPPPAIHTSEATGSGTNQLLDIFAGPRSDFSAKDGWVLNADDYPTAEPEDSR